MSTTSEVLYSEEALVIKIKTGSPAATHYSLLRGLITSLKLHMQNEERIDEDVDGLVTLANMLSSIIPKETQLVNAFTVVKSSVA